MNKLRLVTLLFTTLVFQNFFAQPVVNGKITSLEIPVKFASITFINEADTAQTFSTYTDSSGQYELSLVTGIEDYNNSTAQSNIALAQNYPNPFSTSTAIQYYLNKPSEVNFIIYDLLGKEVRHYNLGTKQGGFYGIVWDGKNSKGVKVVPGIYFYRLQAGKEIVSKKMVIGKGYGGSSTLSNSKFEINNSLRKSDLKNFSKVKYTVVIESDSATSPLIVIKKFVNIEIPETGNLDFEVEKARIIMYESIEGIRLGDDSLSVIEKLGEPSHIEYPNFNGYTLVYQRGAIGNVEIVRVDLYPVDSASVVAISVEGSYIGKTKEGVGLGTSRDEVISKIGYPDYYDQSLPPTDSYRKEVQPPLIQGQFLFYYDQDLKIRQIILGP
ncbi:MAG: T9SS type A sorting domain-containing protein [Ignavibacterium sp.]|nr:MAG: T9SS type A sorting domain-containing protein [Ignavibacterium sp.]